MSTSGGLALGAGLTSTWLGLGLASLLPSYVLFLDFQDHLLSIHTTAEGRGRLGADEEGQSETTSAIAEPKSVRTSSMWFHSVPMGADIGSSSVLERPLVRS